MGSGSSKGSRPAPAMVVPSTLISLPPQPPYGGYPIYYHYITTGAISEIRPQGNDYAAIIDSTSVDSCYPNLTSMYTHGYRMLLFIVLPGSRNYHGFSGSNSTTLKGNFKGMFRALLPEEQSEQLVLNITRSQLTVQMYSEYKSRGNRGIFSAQNHHKGTTSDNSHIIRTVQGVGQAGGRIVNVGFTGMAEQELLAKMEDIEEYSCGDPMPPIRASIDIFYETQRTPSNERYIYQIVACPMVRTEVMERCEIGWQNVMGQYLGAGWRLADIFEDYSVASVSWQMKDGYYNGTWQKNCLFIFEKPASRFQDNTPLYEGTMLDNYVTSRSQMNSLGFGGLNTTTETNWETVVNQMGQYGWQIIRILDTKDQSPVEGMFNQTYQTRQMMFFQRRIAQVQTPVRQQGDEHVYHQSQGGGPSNNQPSGETPQPSAPPSYEQATGEKL